MKKPRKNRQRQLQYEPLESRQLMAVTAGLSGGVLTVTSNDAADTINFKQVDSKVWVNGLSTAWKASKVNSIVVNLNGGNDTVSLNSLANGGNKALSESFMIKGGWGTELVHVANGKSVTFGGPGNTLNVSSAGVASLNGVAVNFTSTIQASFSAGVLKYTGTNGNDTIKFQQWDGWLGIAGGGAWFRASDVTAIVVHLQSGDDYVSLDSLGNYCNQVITAPFTINSSAGNKTVHLANGHDVAFSGLGHQLTVAANNGQVKLDGVVQTFDDPTPPPPPPATNWFDTNVSDAALRTLGHNLYIDNLIDRSDMIALLQNTKDSGVIDATELTDLRNIAAATTLFGTQVHVQTLASYVVNASVANTNYQGGALGNLTAGSADTKLDTLVNKWFLGLDRPNAQDPYGIFNSYRQFAGQLFVSGATYDDIRQGSVGDCYFLASLAEAALRANSSITNMFIVNGDGTYTVKFNGPGGAHYVTVDSYLPTAWNGTLYYATRGLSYTSTGGELWVALAEKAYAQLNEFGWSRPGQYNGQNSYTALNGGYIASALTHITGQATSLGYFTSYGSSFTTFVNAYNAGKLIGFASFSTPASSSVVGSHAYAVVGYNASNQTITLFNPWGVNNGQAPDFVTMTWAQIQQNFQYFDRTI